MSYTSDKPQGSPHARFTQSMGGGGKTKGEAPKVGNMLKMNAVPTPKPGWPAMKSMKLPATLLGDK